MTTSPHESARSGRPTEGAPWTLLPPGATTLAPRVLTDNWTTVHTAAARFIGECFAVGAFLGIVTEMARPVRGRHDG
jgi:hypothetical protein